MNGLKQKKPDGHQATGRAKDFSQAVEFRTLI
jgi:hypothetical protein